MKGVYEYAVISCMKDKSTKGEHAITIHSAHKDEAEAEKYIEDALIKDVMYEDLHVVSMYEWLTVEMAFCEALMEKVRRKYRDPKQNEIMQYQLQKQKRKRSDIAYEYRKKGLEEPQYTTITPDMPDLTKKKAGNEDNKEILDSDEAAPTESPTINSSASVDSSAPTSPDGPTDLP